MDTNAQQLSSDFDAAHDLRETVSGALYDESSNALQADSVQPASLRYVLPDGRKVFVYFPHGRDYMKGALITHLSESTKTCSDVSTSSEDPPSSKDVSQPNPVQLFFVLFVGYKKDFNHCPDLTESSWELDNSLKKDMATIEKILSYASCERTVGGDWTNMVVFTSLDVIDKWRDSPLHVIAVRDFSPQYYSKIRIHRGQIHGDFRNGALNLHRTLFLDYETDEEIPNREEKYWNTSEPSPLHKFKTKSNSDEATGL